MNTLSTGQDSTLGNWIRVVQAFFGRDSPALDFLNAEVSKATHGIEEEVIAEERQLIKLLWEIHNADDDEAREAVAAKVKL